MELNERKWPDMFLYMGTAMKIMVLLLIIYVCASMLSIAPGIGEFALVIWTLVPMDVILSLIIIFMNIRFKAFNMVTLSIMSLANIYAIAFLMDIIIAKDSANISVSGYLSVILGIIVMVLIINDIYLYWRNVKTVNVG